MRRLKYRLRPQGLIVAFGLWGVLGCSTQDTVGLSPPSTKPDPDLSNLPLHHDSAIVGTSGAVISAGEAEVVIPQGALAEPVEIVVQTVQPAAAPGLQTFPEMENETILEFLPHGTQFLRPVTIQVPHHHELSGDLALYTSEPNEPWAPVAGATFTDELAKADVMHFSFFFTSPKPPPPPEPPPATNSGGAGGAPSVEQAKGGSGGAPGAAGAGEPIVDPGDGQAGAPSTGVAGEGGAAGETGNDPGPIVAGDAGVHNPPPDPDPGAGGAGNSSGADAGVAGGGGNTSGGADAGVAGEGGAPNGDPGAGGGSSGSVDAGTGTGGAPPVMDPDYLQNADWRGYLFSVSDDNSTIDRVGVCASGSVASDPQSQSFAAWGWNLNEDKQGPVLSWDPTLQMMHYDIDSSAPVRLSLRDTDGKDWCYALPDVRGDVSFADFNSACWDNSGDFYNGTTPLVSLTVVVPGNDTATVDFQLCVNDLFPEDGPFVPPPPPPPLDYLENKDWHGDLFSIADPSSSVERAGLCAAGTITSNAQFQSFGGWGWNLNQELQSSPLSWDPTLPMMHYDVDSTAQPRLSLRDADGKDWCYVLPDARGDVSFTAFNSACWDNSGDFYDGTTPLVSIGTVIPGNDTTDVDFQLCVNELYPELEAPPPPPPPPQLDYRDIGDWQGHLYSLADDTSFVDRSGMCATGVVSANAQFQSYALWGWNLNQQPDEPALSWDPTLQSIHYFIGSSTPVRLSLRDEQGQDWCYPIDTMTGDVLLTQFNSACWDNSGAFYDGTTPLMSINVVVPGNDIADVDFHFCVSDLFPQDPDAVGGGGGGSAGAGTGGVSGAGGASGGSGSGGAPTAGEGGGAGAPAPPKL